MKRFLILGAVTLAAAAADVRQTFAWSHAKFGLGLQCEVERSGRQQAQSYQQPAQCGSYAPTPAPTQAAPCPPRAAPNGAPPLAAPRYPQGAFHGVVPHGRGTGYTATPSQAFRQPYPGYSGYAGYYGYRR